MEIPIRPKWPFQSPKTVPRLLLPSVLTAGLLGSPFTAYADEGNAVYSVVNRHGHLHVPCVELDDGTIYQAHLNQVPNVEQFLFKLETALLTQPVAGVCAIYDRDKRKISLPVVEVNLGGHKKLYQVDMTVESPAADGAMMFGIAPTVLEIGPNSRGRLRIALSPFAEETTTRIRKKDEDKGSNDKVDKDNTANENEGDANEGPKVTVCHKGKNTLSIAQASLQDHLDHGDTQGACASTPVTQPENDQSENKPDTDKDNSANQPENDKDNSGQPANDKTGGNVTAVWLDINKVKACGDDSGCQLVGGSQRLNLLALDGQALATVADVALLPATFHQLRLVLGNDNTVVADGDTFSLKTPSAQQSGLKIIGDWAVKAGFTTEIQLAFDVVKSIHFNKGQGYMLKPTIKATVVLTALTPSAGDVLNGLADNYAATGSIQINNDALFTETESVTLTFAPTTTPERMRLSVDGQSWGEFEPYRSPRDFLFTDGVLGEKAVYVQYQTGGVTSASEYDQIILAPMYGAEYAASNLPTSMAQGITYAVELSVKNTGTLTWNSQHSEYPVQLLYRWKDSSGTVVEKYGNYGLFANEVAYSQDDNVTFLVRAPLLETLPANTSTLTLEIELEEWGTTLFSEMGVVALTQTVAISDTPLPERPTVDITKMPFGVGGQNGSVLNDPFRFFIK